MFYIVLPILNSYFSLLREEKNLLVHLKDINMLFNYIIQKIQFSSVHIANKINVFNLQIVRIVVFKTKMLFMAVKSDVETFKWNTKNILEMEQKILGSFKTISLTFMLFSPFLSGKKRRNHNIFER